MNETMEALVKRLDPDSVDERKIVVRQAVQEVALNGLSETDFFDRAAFCGGTALRIFHGLDRFSEDLDFSLQNTDWEFSFDEYLPAICGKAQSFGFELEAKSKVKSEGNNIKSAIIKGNTRELLGLCYPDDGSASHVAKDDSARIKIEADVNPPALASYEVLRSSPPLDYTARLHDMPSLFAGKIDAVLCGPWKNRTKGRDLFDFRFYIEKGIPVNMEYLESRIVSKGHADPGDCFDRDRLLDMLRRRFMELDYPSAMEDAGTFAADWASCEGWCPEMFISLSERLAVCRRRPRPRPPA